MHFLTVRSQDAPPSRFTLNSGTTRIGRSSRNDLVLNDPGVSRVHAAVESRDDGDYIRDLGSRCGTWLNNQAITGPTRLGEGDSVLLGSTRLVYDREETPAVRLQESPVPPDSVSISVDEEVRNSQPTLDKRPREVDAASILGLVLEADSELALHRPLELLYKKILALAHRVVPYERGVLMLKRGDDLQPEALQVPGEEADGPIVVSDTIARRVCEDREAVLIRDVPIDETTWDTDSLVGQGIRSVMSVPLLSDEAAIGLLYLDSRQRTSQFNNDNLRLLIHLASVAAIKIENKRLLETTLDAEVLRQQLEQAADIQKHLLPRAAPSVPGYRLCGLSDPCFAVGGDCFDYIELDGGRIALSLGDVAGKGLAAALLASFLQSCLRVVAELGLSPAATVSRLNGLLAQQLPSNRFITLLFGILDPAEHTFTYVNAGQNVPFVVHPGGGIDRLGLGGLPLGILDQTEYEAAVLRLQPGDALVCYSDGAVEATNAAEEHFGQKRLQDVAASAWRQPADKMVHCIAEAIGRYQGDLPDDDDITLVVLQRDRDQA